MWLAGYVPKHKQALRKMSGPDVVSKAGEDQMDVLWSRLVNLEVTAKLMSMTADEGKDAISEGAGVYGRLKHEFDRVILLINCNLQRIPDLLSIHQQQRSATRCYGPGLQGLGIARSCYICAFFTRWLSHGRCAVNLHKGLPGLLTGLRTIVDHKTVLKRTVCFTSGSFRHIATVAYT
jgi:hypothetical protein